MNLAIVAVLHASSPSYVKDSPLPLSMRTQYQQRRSDWREVPHSATPRFGVDARVMLDLLPTTYDGTDTYKVAFSLLNSHFLTPWFSVADGGEERFLTRLQLTLVAAGDTVEAARWEEWHEEGAPPAQVELDIQWEHELEMDVASALGFVFIAGVLLTGLLLYIVLREDARTAAAAKRGERTQHAGVLSTMRGAREKFL
jgi:hypothetical protein